MMFLAVQKDIFQPDKQLAQLLTELARLANNLYNQGVYESRQYFFEQGRKPFKVLNYVNLYFCLENDIDTIIYGRNNGQKDEINLGAKTNQEFVQIPHYKLFGRIEQLCLIFGIRLVETEESYTSQASFFDNDFLPTFGEKPEGWKASGKRILRGLYRTAQGWLINADCNGACNIMRKVSTKLNIDLSGVCRGAVAAPSKVKLGQIGFALA